MVTEFSLFATPNPAFCKNCGKAPDVVHPKPLSGAPRRLLLLLPLLPLLLPSRSGLLERLLAFLPSLPAPLTSPYVPLRGWWAIMLGWGKK